MLCCCKYCLMDVDGAAEAKNKVEEKQRASRKERKRADKDWNPKLVKLQTNVKLFFVFSFFY